MVDSQSQRNRDSRDRWLQYTSHRSEVTRLIATCVPPGKRLLALGAGNCNDLDLKFLRERFSEVHLADGDAEALAWGVESQGAASGDRSNGSGITLHGGVDLAGFDLLGFEHPEQGPPESAEWAEWLLQRAVSLDWPSLPADCDVVTSIGLLSQIIESVLKRVPLEHPRFMAILTQVRLRHLRLMLERLRPGGHALLVIEMVSSSSCPALKSATSATLPEVIAEALRSRNFFTGLNPLVLARAWHQWPELDELTESVTMSPPWVWDFGPRLYACQAFDAVRR